MIYLGWLMVVCGLLDSPNHFWRAFAEVTLGACLLVAHEGLEAYRKRTRVHVVQNFPSSE